MNTQKTLKDITLESVMRNANIMSAIRLGIIDRNIYETVYQPIVEKEINEIESIIKNSVPQL